MIVNDDGMLIEKGTAVADAQNANHWLYTTREGAASGRGRKAFVR